MARAAIGGDVQFERVRNFAVFIGRDAQHDRDRKVGAGDADLPEVRVRGDQSVGEDSQILRDWANFAGWAACCSVVIPFSFTVSRHRFCWASVMVPLRLPVKF